MAKLDEVAWWTAEVDKVSPPDEVVFDESVECGVETRRVFDLEDESVILTLSSAPGTIVLLTGLSVLWAGDKDLTLLLDDHDKLDDSNVQSVVIIDVTVFTVFVSSTRVVLFDDTLGDGVCHRVIVFVASRLIVVASAIFVLRLWSSACCAMTKANVVKRMTQIIITRQQLPPRIKCFLVGDVSLLSRLGATRSDEYTEGETRFSCVKGSALSVPRW